MARAKKRKAEDVPPHELVKKLKAGDVTSHELPEKPKANDVSIHKPIKKHKADESCNGLPKVPVSAVAAARAQREGHSTPLKQVKEEDGTNKNLVASVSGRDNISDLRSSDVDEARPEALYCQPDNPRLDYDSEAEGKAQVDGVVIPAIFQLPNASRLLCTWKPSATNVIASDDERVILHLDSNTTLAVLGQYDLEILAGRINLYGATLQAGPSPYRVYAASTHAIPLINNSGRGVATIELRTCERTMRPLKRLCPLFARIWNYRAEKSDVVKRATDRRSFSYISESSDDPWKRYLTTLDVRPPWQSLLDDIFIKEDSPPPMIMVCGPKASGKSTFCRLLTNRLLTAKVWARTSKGPGWHVLKEQPSHVVFFLDLDPGQPEFSPPGMLSLVHIRSPNFGPPYTHPTTDISTSYRTMRSHFFGVLSPIEDSEHFIACTIDLLQGYHEHLRDYPLSPLIVNCPGWIINSGLELTTTLIRLFPFTDVVYTSTGPAEIVKVVAGAIGRDTKFRQIPPQPSPFATRTPADLRTMQMFSYFHQAEPIGGNLEWITTPITHMRPWVINYGEELGDVLGIMTVGEYIPAQFLSTVIEGSVLAVVVLDEDSEPIPDQGASEPDNSLQQIASRLARLNSQIDDADYDSPLSGSPAGSRQNSIDTGSSTPGQGLPATQDTRPGEAIAKYVSVARRPIQRTPIENLPYIASVDAGSNAALDPRTSQCLGLALLRAIDVENQTLHLLTPMSELTIAELQQRPGEASNVILVHGRLDTPAWAYQEDLVLADYQTSRRRAETPESGGQSDAESTTTERQKIEMKIPWVTELRSEGKTIGERVLRRRPDLKSRHSSRGGYSSGEGQLARGGLPSRGQHPSRGGNSSRGGAMS